MELGVKFAPETIIALHNVPPQPFAVYWVEPSDTVTEGGGGGLLTPTGPDEVQPLQPAGLQA